MAQLAIQGHTTRGEEVIEILEMLGGRNPHNYSAVCGSLCFYIGKENNIIYYDWVDCCEDEDILVFTLEEFLEKYPYKVGDKVKDAIIEDYVGTIIEAQWDNYKKEVVYTVIWDNMKELSYFAKDLQPYKEETMEERDEKAVNHVFETEVISFDIAQRDKYELDLQGKFEVVLREGKYYVERIKPQYPKTFVECAKILDCFGAAHIDGYKCELLDKLQELLICRDAYWKIAGEQMGLGKPWEPYWTIYKHKFCLGTDKDKVIEECVTTGNRILAFPTEEMRDAFYENFNDLIEECKEFL